MSSMRNAVQRRNHRERGQPEERQKWGLLEKHKDYSARARDFNRKKAKLRALKQKVLEKNPDEFYFGMMSKKGPSAAGKNSTGTLNGDRGNKILSQEASRLFKTQDMGYVRTMRNKAIKEMEMLEKKVIGLQSEGSRIVFIGDEEAQQEKMEEDEFNNDAENDEVEVDLDTKNLRKLQQKEKEKLEAKLEISRERLKALTDAEEALDLQRARMGKSPTVGGITKTGAKFKIRQRKR